MHTDVSKASAFENLVMHTEGNQTHATNDVETVRELLKRESDSKDLQEGMVSDGEDAELLVYLVREEKDIYIGVVVLV